MKLFCDVVLFIERSDVLLVIERSKALLVFERRSNIWEWEMDWWWIFFVNFHVKEYLTSDLQVQLTYLNE